jgi:Ser/Thr protein kinase RdoA (MazF antagonist)
MMTIRSEPLKLEIAQSTPTAAGIAGLVQARYALGEVVESEFLRRSFNQVYRLSFASGQRAVARLCADRPRGLPNLRFEAEALEHWAQQGCAVARCLRSASGDVSVSVALPEGSRQLMLFEFLDGEATGTSAEHVEAFARGLATLHTAGAGYRGSDSAYALDLDYLLLRPLERLLQAPTMTAELRAQFETLGRRLHDRILSLGALRQVLCHGDAHGENNFIVQRPGGRHEALFFDFDEAGPGILAYELAVYPWSLYPRVPDIAFSDDRKAQWLQFIHTYREARPIPDLDVAAVAPFMSVRQFWLLGEYAGRIPVWGSQAMSTDMLRRQAEMLRRWESLELPGCV